jgi:hypothetical protein
MTLALLGQTRHMSVVRLHPEVSQPQPLGASRPKHAPQGWAPRQPDPLLRFEWETKEEDPGGQGPAPTVTEGTIPQAATSLTSPQPLCSV